ncbi:hypothetical protein NDU88_004924 [Pleurodeles waltl]|uniref:Uncharacterized protein n=1 Tax=Pleurodeles waltl TaxID=8319 RepID=A0AAV7MWI7_PLEWA|nr:hypothetical protein NDU88_004924 [Pleurodeles waltl]
MHCVVTLATRVVPPPHHRVWVINRVAGTMVTAQRVTETVTQNISWFRKTAFEELLTDEPDLTRSTNETTRNPKTPEEEDQQLSQALRTLS